MFAHTGQEVCKEKVQSISLSLTHCNASFDAKRKCGFDAITLFSEENVLSISLTRCNASFDAITLFSEEEVLSISH